MQFFSCSTDYDGPAPENESPIINIYETTDVTSSKKTKIQWYGNDIDGNRLTYYYTVTTDTTLNTENVLAAMPLTGTNTEGRKLWTSTQLTYAYISMPYGPYPDPTTTVFEIDTVYTEPLDGTFVTQRFKAVYSKFFVFGIDENDSTTEISSKIFRRTNRIPKHPMVYSSKLGQNGFDKYWMTVGPDSAYMVLEAPTAFWKPFDFKWMGEDPDGQDVDLEFMWLLLERNRVSGVDIIIDTVATSNGWSVNNLSKSFSKEIWDHNKQGQYAFKVFVRDDAFEESLNHATINFEVFAPEFDKGILFIDDTDPTLYQPTGSLYMGNPETSETTGTRAFYESLLDYAGFEPESIATDPMKGYKIKRFSKGEVFVGWDYEYELQDHDDDPGTPDVQVLVDSTAVYRGVYDPSVRELTQYRLVIIASDDRGNLNGVDFAGEPPYTGYNTSLSSLLDVGGNLFIAGPSVLMGKLYASPNQLPINKYLEPFRIVFDGYASALQGLSAGTEDFFNKYFGIYSTTFPEQKTYFTDLSSTQLCADHYLADNYDFIGSTVYEHISDPMIKPLRIDSAMVKLAWWDRTVAGKIQKLALKDKGTVFTGIPTFEAYKGEVIYRYQSIYDLPVRDQNYSYEINGADTLTHYLWNKRFRVEEFESSPNFATQTTIGNWTQEAVVAERWATNTTTPFSLLRSLKSGVIAANDTSDVFVSNVELLSEGTISFAYRTSSYIDPADSLTGDVLNFYIDGVNMSALEETKLWCGENEWRQVSYNLGSGKHNFKWQYLKGGAGPGGSDAVWIDKLLITDTYSPVLRRSGSVGTRYVAEGDIFKTAILTIPLYFLDNTNNQVSDMFKTMVEWFDINNDGGSK
jgi:hypothetical protein